jgi:hypothetical protein
MSLSRKQAILFHGFLGSERDFESLTPEYQIHPIDLKPQKLNLNTVVQANSNLSRDLQDYESWEQLKARVFLSFQKILKSCAKEDEILILSYSMGSKVLFSIWDQVLGSIIELSAELSLRSKIKFVFLSTHFGLYDSQHELSEELNYREKMNEKFLNLLNKTSKNKFIEEWNSLGLFSKDVNASTDWTEAQIKHYFKFWNQSQTQNIIPNLMKLPKFFVFYGEEDLKYKVQAERLKETMKDKCVVYGIKSRSHRLLDPKDLNYIKNELKD